jgi:hypothetical protein
MALADAIFVALARTSGYLGEQQLEQLRALQSERAQGNERPALFDLARSHGLLDADATRRLERWADQIQRGERSPLTESGERVVHENASDLGTVAAIECPWCHARLDAEAIRAGRARRRDGKNECTTCYATASGSSATEPKPASPTPSSRSPIVVPGRTTAPLPPPSAPTRPVAPVPPPLAPLPPPSPQQPAPVPAPTNVPGTEKTASLPPELAAFAAGAPATAPIVEKEASGHAPGTSPSGRLKTTSSGRPRAVARTASGRIVTPSSSRAPTRSRGRIGVAQRAQDARGVILAAAIVLAGAGIAVRIVSDKRSGEKTEPEDAPRSQRPVALSSDPLVLAKRTVREAEALEREKGIDAALALLDAAVDRESVPDARAILERARSALLARGSGSARDPLTRRDPDQPVAPSPRRDSREPLPASSTDARGLLDDARDYLHAGDLVTAEEEVEAAAALDPRAAGLSALRAEIAAARARESTRPPVRPADVPGLTAPPPPDPSKGLPPAQDPKGPPPAQDSKPASAPGEVVERYPDGSVKARYRTDAKGRKQGAYVELDPTGKVSVKAYYMAGKLHGEFLELYPNGRTKLSAHYKNDELVGRVVQYDPAGKVLSNEAYVDGKFREMANRVRHPRSKEEIARALAAIARAPVRDGAPKSSPAFEPLASAQQEQLLRKLSEYRYLCGVPHDMELSGEYAELCAAGTRLLESVGHLEHKPARPPGITDVLWNLGYAGTSQCNLADNSPVAGMVDLWMEDSDFSNVSRVGHRRWCLNPAMKRTAFGYYNQRWGAMYAFDTSRENARLDRVAYPAEGYFPTTHLSQEAAWSVSFDPEVYKAPESKEDVKVVVTPLDEHLRPGKPEEISELYLNRDLIGGSALCLIWKSSALVSPGKRYLVEIRGFLSKADEPIEYVVDFYDPSR